MYAIQNAFMRVTLNCGSCREAYLISYNLLACTKFIQCARSIVTAGYVLSWFQCIQTLGASVMHVSIYNSQSINHNVYYDVVATYAKLDEWSITSKRTQILYNQISKEVIYLCIRFTYMHVLYEYIIAF